MNTLPPPEVLHKLLTYDPSTGKLFWKPRDINMFRTERAYKAWNTRYANIEAGTISKVSKSDTLAYIQVSIDDRLYRAHMLIWIMHNNTISGVIDHIDGDGLNNKLSNLRDIKQSSNIRKCKMRKNNTNGYRGVSLTDSGKYAVAITKNRKKIHLGRYTDIAYAGRVYATAELILEGEVFSECIPFDINSEEYKNIIAKI